MLGEFMASWAINAQSLCATRAGRLSCAQEGVAHPHKRLRDSHTGRNKGPVSIVRLWIAGANALRH